MPRGLIKRLTDHQVTTVQDEGWDSIKNGQLLDLIESAGFEVLITNDKRMEREQQLKRRPFATLLLSVNNWKIVRETVPDIQAALEHAEPGVVRRVECGRFVPKRFRRSVDPTS